MRLYLLTLLLVCFSASSQRCLSQIPDLRLKAGVATFSRIEEVIAGWRPDRHVFVQGELGIGRRQLDELQNWIDQNAPNWTVVLMESAQGERYRAPDGRDYIGLDAVEHALGFGLGNQTDFGKLEHPQTHERNGAVFVLFLLERKFSYYGSDAQDRRGLGEANWMGELDQPAFRAMRGGGRIVDAAKDTIQSIDAKLAKAISAETASAQRAQQERERTVDEVRRGLATVRERFDDVKIQAAEFRDKNPTATGPLAAPPLVQWETEVAAIEQELSPETARELSQRLAKLSAEVERHLNAHAGYLGLGERSQNFLQMFAELEKSPGRVADPAISTARKLLDEAQQAAKSGQLGIEERLLQVDAAVQSGQTLMQEETERIERARLRSQWIRRTVLFMLGLLSLATLGILAILNRRRRPAMLTAQAELAKREASVAEETDGINTLFVRNEDILGSPEQLKKRGYEGITQKTSEQALKYVDDLFIMSKEIRRVVSEARELIYPSSIVGRIVNLFSGSRYQQAINEVSGKPLRFNSINGLPLVLRDQIALNNDGSVPQEISMTFEDVFQSFQKRGDEAENALDTIESSLANINESLSSLQSELEKTTTVEKELAIAANKDHYFSLPNFFDKLIPSVQSDVTTADKLAAFNAVQAMHSEIPSGRRKLAEANALASKLSDARANLFPALTNFADELGKLGYTSSWIDDDLVAITLRANELLDLATQRSIASELPEVEARLNELQAKAELSVQFANRISVELAPAINSLKQRVDAGRDSLAHSLSVSSGMVLNETNRDPDDWLASAATKLETARSTLATGRNEVVQAAIEAMQADAARADEILQASLKAVEDNAQQRQLANDELQRLRQRIPVTGRELQPLLSTYEATALILPDIDDGNDQTLENTLSASAMIELAQSPVSRVEMLLVEAEKEKNQAKVLQAQESLHEASLLLTQSHQRLDAVHQHIQAVAAQTRENAAELNRLDQQCGELVRKSSNPLVMEQTGTAVGRLKQTIDGWRKDALVSQSVRDPFSVKKELADMKLSIIQLNAQCDSDRQAHAEASRAVEGAARQLEVAQQLVRQSQTDGIPDSQVILQANAKIASLARSLESVKRDLNAPHGMWKAVDDNASSIQVELRSATDKLGGELQNASQALASFQSASQAVFQAEQWSGTYGIRVTGSPGVYELERARSGLQQGNYNQVLELTRAAMTVAQAAVQQAEREVQRQRFAAQQAAEAERRRLERRRQSNSPLGGGGFTMGGGSFGGGSRGGSFSSSSSRSSSSGGNSSGFGRSGW